MEIQSSVETVSTLRSMRKTAEDFEIVSRNGMEVDLGRGASGQVKLVKDRSNGRHYAMKLVIETQK